MRAISDLVSLGHVSLEHNPTNAPQQSTSGDPFGIALPTSRPGPRDEFIEGDPDRPQFQTRDFSNGAIFVKIPGIIDVGDLPDGLTVDLRA